MVCLSGDKVCISLRPRSGVFDSAGSRLARVFASARCCLPCCLTPSAPRNTRFRSSIPSLQIPLSNASRAALRLPSHGSGPGWFAIPSLYDSFIRYSMPVYPGAIQTWGSAPRLHLDPRLWENQVTLGCHPAPQPNSVKARRRRGWPARVLLLRPGRPCGDRTTTGFARSLRLPADR